MGARYTPEQLDWLRDGYTRLRLDALTDAFNVRFGEDRTEEQIRSALRNHRFTCGRPTGWQKGEQPRLLTPEQDGFLREGYTRMTLAELAPAMNREFGLSLTPAQLKSYTSRYGVHSGRTGRFPKGSQPWNAGTKGLAQPNSGSFKKGNVPANLRPVGHERVNAQDNLVLVKTAETNPHTGFKGYYRYKHVVAWEQANGQPVPEGYVVRFRDGDSRNFSADNLILVTKAEHLRLNQLGYLDTPDEFKPAVLALAKLETATFQREKE